METSNFPIQVIKIARLLALLQRKSHQATVKPPYFFASHMCYLNVSEHLSLTHLTNRSSAANLICALTSMSVPSNFGQAFE